MEGVECKESTIKPEKPSERKKERRTGWGVCARKRKKEWGRKKEYERRTRRKREREKARRRGRSEQLFHDDGEGGVPTLCRELRGSGVRGYIIKKQETSSFSPALVKILNEGGLYVAGDASSRALARAPRHAHTRGFPLHVPPRRTHTRTRVTRISR